MFQSSANLQESYLSMSWFDVNSANYEWVTSDPDGIFFLVQGKLPAAFYRIQDLEAQRFIGRCLVTASKRLSAKELLLDPFLASDEAKTLPMTSIRNQKPFLNEREMEKLHLEDPPRTDMRITGKLNAEDDTVFLKVLIADKDGITPNCKTYGFGLIISTCKYFLCHIL